mmetsp:Transcript_28487/g.50925  ORF Transcript_28487/g.50925 Transcript_28487/m.50925 type:complete len:208 (+) Transcript_28487:1804-2427(+)
MASCKTCEIAFSGSLFSFCSTAGVGARGSASLWSLWVASSLSTSASRVTSSSASRGASSSASASSSGSKNSSSSAGSSCSWTTWLVSSDASALASSKVTLSISLSDNFGTSGLCSAEASKAASSASSSMFSSKGGEAWKVRRPSSRLFRLDRLPKVDTSELGVRSGLGPKLSNRGPSLTSAEAPASSLASRVRELTAGGVSGFLKPP